MKKIFVFILLMSIFLINFTTISAASGQKNIEAILYDTPDVVKVGETVFLTATTEKHGSCYNDNWSNAVKSFTILDNDTDTYISKAAFIAEKPGIYNISYSIDMSAGKSDVAFSGKVERTIIVTNPVILAGADIRDLIIKPVYKSDGSISVYSAFGRVYALWSDHTATPYSSIFFYFGPNETEKNTSVTISSNGIQYKYVVTVRR